MGLDSTNRDDSFWDTIGTQTTTRDTILAVWDTIWDSFHGPSPSPSPSPNLFSGVSVPGASVLGYGLPPIEFSTLSSNSM